MYWSLLKLYRSLLTLYTHTKIAYSKVSHKEGGDGRPVKREGAVSLNSTEEEEEEAKQWEQQGSPRWLIRVLEGMCIGLF